MGEILTSPILYYPQKQIAQKSSELVIQLQACWPIHEPGDGTLQAFHSPASKNRVDLQSNPVRIINDVGTQRYTDNHVIRDKP